MATCSVIDKAFNRLWENGVLKEGKTRIQDPIRFDALNTQFSDVARSQFGVTNPGKFFDISTQNITHTGPLNLYGHKGEKTFDYTAAVVNREFTDEFQQKFEDYYNQQALVESRVITEPPVLTSTLQAKHDELKKSIEDSDHPAVYKEYLMYELNTSRSVEDFGALKKQLC